MLVSEKFKEKICASDFWMVRLFILVFYIADELGSDRNMLGDEFGSDYD